MKVKNINLEYYVLYNEFNSKKIKRYNILNEYLVQDIVKQVKRKNITNLTELKEFLRKDFMYHYWAKAEWEIAVGGLFAKYPEQFEKIDIWYQIENNLDVIVTYINNKMELNFK